MKVLHAADIHARDKDIEEIERCLGFVVDAAANEAVNLAVIAGDIFDSQDIKLDSASAKLIVRQVSRLANICPVFIVIGTSSHDGQAAQILQYVKGFNPIFVADKPIQTTMPGAVLTLIPQPDKRYFQGTDLEISAAMSGILAGFGASAAGYDCPHVLVYHGGISGAKMSNGQTLIGRDIELSIDQLNLSGAHLKLLGHIHFPQELKDNTFYSGSIYTVSWGEDHPHGFYLHEIING